MAAKKIWVTRPRSNSLPIPMKPGRPARFDYEYERNGTDNLFMMFAPLEGWRHVKVTDRHTAVDYAHVLKELADVHFANAKTIALVQDNLNIHSKASLNEAFTAMHSCQPVRRCAPTATKPPGHRALAAMVSLHDTRRSICRSSRRHWARMPNERWFSHPFPGILRKT